MIIDKRGNAPTYVIVTEGGKRVLKNQFTLSREELAPGDIKTALRSALRVLLKNDGKRQYGV